MRTKPVFGRKEVAETPAGKADPTGCVWTVILIVLGYIVVSAILRVTSGGGSRLDGFICYGSLAGLGVMLLLGLRDGIRSRRALEAEGRQWMNSCTSDEVAIVKREHFPGRANDDGYEIHYYRASHHLYLALNADQRAAAGDKEVLCIDVRGPVYEKLEGRDRVRIYYRPESPLTFLLEEEIP
jgi:hypothetical protein